MKNVFILCRLIAAATLLSGCATFVSSEHRTEDYTIVFQEASAGDVASIKAAIRADPTVLHAREWDGATLLHDAVQRDHPDLTLFLLENGADVNAVTQDGLTPLHMAATNGNVAIAEILLSHRAKINIRDSKGWTPLDRAERWNHPGAAEFLKQRGALH